MPVTILIRKSKDTFRPYSNSCTRDCLEQTGRDHGSVTSGYGELFDGSVYGARATPVQMGRIGVASTDVTR
jgi:hypothetical protein